MWQKNYRMRILGEYGKMVAMYGGISFFKGWGGLIGKYFSCSY